MSKKVLKVRKKNLTLSFILIGLIILSAAVITAVYALDNNIDSPAGASPKPLGSYNVTNTVSNSTPSPEATSQTPSITPEISPTPSKEPVTKITISVPMILQDPELPTGCEIVSATMLLQYYGFNADKMEMADRLPKTTKPDSSGYGPDPREYFLGDPSRSDSMGCYAPVIKKTLDQYLSDKGSGLKVVDITGCQFSKLKELLRQNKPVLVWATMRMAPVSSTKTWTLHGSNEEFTWIRPEHCLVLVGFNDDEQTYIFNDPQAGVVPYSADSFETAWNALHCQALYIE